jgi:hypothetical protein
MSFLPGLVLQPLATKVVPYVGAIDIGLQVNKYVFLPVVERGVKELYGALGEDPIKTQMEIEYARANYFNPTFDFI